MNFDISSRTILLVRHGSHAYGLSTPTSDEDFKGVCIKPREFYLGFLHRFEQHEHMGSKSDGIDSVIYSLDKFAKLAADCNPNIIEVLHVDDSDVVKIDTFGEALRACRYDFVSKKARYTFAGYAHAQLKRIKTHRAWLLDPPKAPPVRSDFGLSETAMVSKSELGAFDSLLGQRSVDDEAMSPERADEVTKAARQSLGVELPKDIVTLFTREKAYQAALAHYGQYRAWVKSRNPKRVELEAKFGYDTKHGMHLLRLMRMCKEILSSGKVVVKRPDRSDLMLVREGGVSYDYLVEAAERLEAECAALYETSALPREPDRQMIDRFVIDLTEQYLKLHG